MRSLRTGSNDSVLLPIRADQEADRMEIPSLVVSIVKARTTIEKSQLHEICEAKVETCIPPFSQMPVFEMLPFGEVGCDGRVFVK